MRATPADAGGSPSDQEGVGPVSPGLEDGVRSEAEAFVGAGHLESDGAERAYVLIAVLLEGGCRAFEENRDPTDQVGHPFPCLFHQLLEVCPAVVMASSANSSLPRGKKWYSDEKRASAVVRISLTPSR